MTGKDSTLDIGRETLERMREVTRYNDWIFSKIRPFLGKRILEVGSGIGNFSEKFLKESELVVFLTDCDEKYIRILRERFGDEPHVKIFPYDLNCPHPDITGMNIDTVVCLNVLEHVQQEEYALGQLHEILSDGGRLILQLPAHRWLYGSLDRELGHYRRYEWEETHVLMEKLGFVIEDIFFFNLFGVPGWFVNSRLLKRRILPGGQLKLFNLLAPLFILTEKALRPPIGLSLFCIARKESR